LTTYFRFRVRILQKAKLLIDDWCVVPAAILLIGMTAVVIFGVARRVLGHTVPTTENGVPVGPDEITSAQVLNNKIIFCILSVCWLQLGLTKLSLLFFYRRIFCTAKTTGILNFVIIGTIVITVMWSIAFFFANLFECGTVFSADWNDNDEDVIASCVNEEWLSEAQFISDFILDAILFFMPLPTVWSLNMPIKRRIAVVLILAMGALTMVASIIKVVIIIGLVDDVNNDFIAPDPNILNSILIFWTMFECGIATIVISLPTLRYYLDMSGGDILRSLRSMISLQSLASLGSRGTRGSGNRTRDNIRLPDQHSISSQTGITRIDGLEEGMGNEAHVMKDMPSHGLGHMKSGIMVESHVRQDFDERQDYESRAKEDV